MTRTWLKTSRTITDGFYNLTALKQFALLFTFSLCITLICGTTFWIAGQQHDNAYQSSDSTAQGNANQQSNNNKAASSYDMFDKSQLGSSQFIETARYWHALEMELAHTIGTFDQVKTARVHLAIPKTSVFVDQHNKATASVLIELYSGQIFTKSQVDAVKKLVASSVQQLNNHDVTVVDNEGHLLPYDYQQTASDTLSDEESITTFQPRTIDQPWFLSAVKSALIGLIVFLLLIVARTIVQLLAQTNKKTKTKRVTPRMNSDYNEDQTFIGDSLSQSQHNGQWRQVNKLAADDPAYIANVIKKWVGEE